MNLFACRKVEGQRRAFSRPTRAVAAGTAMTLLSFIGLPTMALTAQAAVAPVGQGFTVTPADLAFILKQIKIAEAHVANTTSATGPCGALVGKGPDQIPDPLTSYGLRTVDGSCNNLIAGRETYGTADQTFPRWTAAVFKDAEPSPAGSAAPASTSYQQKSGTVSDTEPRVISNLIVDQTSTNPAAVAAAGFPVRTQGNAGRGPLHHRPRPAGDPAGRGVPAGCVPSHTRCSSRTSPPTSASRRRTTRCSPCSASSSTTAWTRRSRAAPRSSCRSRVTTRWSPPDHVFGNGDDLPAAALHGAHPGAEPARPTASWDGR